MRLKLNFYKTELILIGNQRQIDKCSTTSMILDSNLIQVSKYVKYLGGGLDQHLNFKKHVGNACTKAMANFVKVHGIRRNYTNIILYGLPDTTICHLQRIQNMCAKLVFHKHKFTSMYEALKTHQATNHI